VARIEAKVADILNDREVVLNKGKDDGVSTGMRFAIMERQPHKVMDPDTGDLLDRIDLVKTVVKVVRVTPHVAIARTFRMVGATHGLIRITPSPGRPEEIYTDQPTIESQYGGEPVRRGDRAVQTTGDEYTESD
jgi:hypothetical protein